MHRRPAMSQLAAELKERSLRFALRYPDRLRAAEMRVRRNDQAGILFCTLHQSQLEGLQIGQDEANGLSGGQSKIRCHLIIAAAARMQLARGSADFRRQGCFYECMHILIRRRLYLVRGERRSFLDQQSGGAADYRS